MVVIDRDGKEFLIHSLILNDCIPMRFDIEKALLALNLEDILALTAVSQQQYSEEEKIQALRKCIRIALSEDTIPLGVDWEMAKAIMIDYLGLGRLYGMNDKKFFVGTKIIDRNGGEHIAYSYLLREYDEAINLLSKVNLLDTSENIINEESTTAMIEILYRALDRKVSKEEIISFADADFARQAMRVYYDLPHL